MAQRYYNEATGMHATFSKETLAGVGPGWSKVDDDHVADPAAVANSAGSGGASPQAAASPAPVDREALKAELKAELEAEAKAEADKAAAARRAAAAAAAKK